MRIQVAVRTVADPNARKPVAFRRSAADVVAQLATARAAKRCSTDKAEFKTEIAAETVLSLAGWIWDLHNDRSPWGLARLRGPGVDLIAPIQVDKSRPDVAAALHQDAAGRAGYSDDIIADGLKPGAYALTVYRRSGAGWIACARRQLALDNAR